VYLHLRVSKYGICFPTQDEMAFELGLSGTKNLIPYLRSLESKKLISTRTSMGKKFYLVHDPQIGIQHLINTGKIAAEELEDLNQLCSDLKQQPFEAPRKIIRRSADEAESTPAQLLDAVAVDR
jgi:hypothetical protein